MPRHPATEQLAEALRVNIGLIVRRLRQRPDEDDVTMPETAALKRLELGGPTTASALAKLEGISPQSMGAILGALDARKWIKRVPDQADRRQSIVSLTAAGRAALRDRRNARTQQIALVLAEHFTPAEIERLLAAMPLFERLAQQL
jgi:DNA-binding MarR family transcriptional regulator